MPEASESISIFTAKTTNGDVIFIDQAQSGQNGYYCRSCGFDLVAKIGTGKYVAHFAHAVRNAQQKAQCTFADESYRHKLAKTILQRIKQVKVPDVLVYPPAEVTGFVKRIRLAEIIRAHQVENELTLRVTADGTLQVGRFSEIELDESGDFHIRPDVTFLDENLRPILLIELVATNRPDAEKLARLNLIGIDTIRIDLPRHSVDAIEHSFHTTQNTRWLYNHEQARAIYATIPDSAGQRVPEFDAVQEQSVQEDIRCRTSRLRNLIRGIKGYLGSESNRQTTAAIDAAIRRVIAEQTVVEQRARERTESIKQSIRGFFRDQVEEITREEARLSQEEAAVDAAEAELGNEEAAIEEKYSRETDRIDRDQDIVRNRPDPRVDRIEAEIVATKRLIDERRREISEYEATARETYERAVGDFQREVAECETEYAAAHGRCSDSIAARNRIRTATYNTADVERRLRKRIEDVGKRIEQTVKPRITSLRAEFDRLEGAAGSSAEVIDQQTQRDVERLERAAEQAVRSGDITQLPPELRVFKEFLSGWQDVRDYQCQVEANRRIREVIYEIEQATWKDWYKPR